MGLVMMKNSRSFVRQGALFATTKKALLFFVRALALALLLLPGWLNATILTFEDFAANNSDVNTVANPFGAGQYGSRAASAISLGFQQGDGFTPNIVLTWSAGWQTYTGWPFGNDAQTG